MIQFFRNLLKSKPAAPSNTHLLRLRSFAGTLVWEYTSIPEALSQRPDLVFLINLLHAQKVVDPEFITATPYLWKPAIALLKEPALSLLQQLKQPEETTVRVREIFQALAELQGVEDAAYDTGLGELDDIFSGITGAGDVT